MSEAGVAPGPNARVALLLSVCVPGLGLLYAGAPLRGLAFMAVAWLGLGGIVMGFGHSHLRFYPAYAAIGIAMLVGAWWGGVRHTRAFAAQAQAWPPLYRWLLRPALRQALWPARVEIGMALVFCVLAMLHVLQPAPRWLPDTPRYWFLYEAFGALYLAAFHAVLRAAGGSDRRRAAVRTTAFLAITALATALLAIFGRLPKDVVLLAYVLALPSCWFSLRHRTEEPERLHAARFVFCLMSGFIALFAMAIVVEAWSGVAGTPQYRMELLRNDDFVLAALGAFYYVFRAGFEALVHKSEGRP